MNGKRLAKISAQTATICGVIVLIPAAIVWFNGWTIIYEEPPRFGSFIEMIPFYDDMPSISDPDGEKVFMTRKIPTRHHFRLGYLGIVTRRDGRHTRAEIEASDRTFRHD